MYRIKIYGAGSIGNHLAYACRNKNLNVHIFDIDSEALRRTKEEIYPSRYGKWDNSIQLSNSINDLYESYDVIIIGTPPDQHLKLAIENLKKKPPEILLIEKPLCTPNLKQLETLSQLAQKTKTKVLVSYNHTTTENTVFAEKVLSEGTIGKIETINVHWCEHWGGIFKAHPWLDGPQDSYLGNINRGGGALSEHSHCISIFNHFSKFTGNGVISEVNATMDIENPSSRNLYYDKISILGVKTNKNLTGSIITDVITLPARKEVRIQGSEGYLHWYVNYDNEHDAVIYCAKNSNKQKHLIPKKRPDDFKNQINLIMNILDQKKVIETPIDLQTGIDVMMVVNAALESNKLKESITISNPKI